MFIFSSVPYFCQFGHGSIWIPKSEPQMLSNHSLPRYMVPPQTPGRRWITWDGTHQKTGRTRKIIKISKVPKRDRIWYVTMEDIYLPTWFRIKTTFMYIKTNHMQILSNFGRGHLTHTIHVWYIYLHFVDFYVGKYTTHWMLWVISL